VRFSPGPHCAGQPITMSFYVVNSGCFDAPATSVRFRVDGNTVEEQPFASLAGKGEGRSVSFARAFAPGTYTVSFELDPLGAAAECNDSNNLISASLTVVTCPAGGNLDYRIDACALSASEEEPVLNQPIHFLASVTNAGTLPGALPLTVRFLFDGVAFGTDVTTSSPLAAGASDVVQSSLTWPVDFAPHRLEVVLDPLDVEPESSEVNNTAARVLPYELAPVPIPSCPGSGASMFSACSPCVNASVSILGYVINTGLFSVPDGQLVDVEFEDGFGGTPLLLASSTVTNLRARGECSPASLDSATVVAQFAAGAHPITFRVDPGNAWPEYLETNNALTRTLSVSSCIPLPDLFVRSELINPSDLNLAPGERLTWINVTVKNQGSGEATDVTVDLSIDGQPLCADLFIEELPLGGSDTVECRISWVAPVGPPNVHVIQASIDPASGGETNLANNSATRAIIVGPAPDLYLAAENIVPLAGGGFGSYGAWIRVGNAGPVAGSAELAINVLDGAGQATLVDQIPVSVPAATGADGEVWVLARWETNERQAHVRAVLTSVAPQDYDETNGIAEWTIYSGPRTRKRP
jgi:subtilase family serine protease